MSINCLSLSTLCRVTNVLWKAVILHQNGMSRSTVGPSMVDNNHHHRSSYNNNNKEGLRQPLQGRRSHTISTAGVDPFPALIAVLPARAISFPFRLAANACR